ncbi:Sodium:sulfate symporter transmembrane region family protein [Histomonas meleagridis]|uniref:Sodium:sulfate symporter transmembrane region family protein n=1 Tax=Histomonas meleagridis TaxID=135588 RepID=UPI003559A7B5|nr:Sodium:sulfate symporter transmembrane region family protein [Histomonas meleagridis]KAH0799032.1 Sodium:sulfate symporter transmembrane region family protein [Histomonas meleagridis]
MIVGSFLSNVTSTTLTLSLAMPIIKTLNPTDPFAKAILFGIAWSGNCGGMPTTIASPQNVIAVRVVNDSGSHISFLQWCFFAFPTSTTLCLIQWLYLVKVFSVGSHDRIKVQSTNEEEKWTFQHTQASIVTIITIILWAFSDTFGDFFGHIGIISLIPIVWFFGNGTLTVNDFNSLKWSTLSLLGGGLALGEAMKLSGLLDIIADYAKDSLNGITVWTLLIILLFVESLLASLLSSTTAASIMFPLIMAVSGTTGKSPLVVLLSALMISCSQLFHISSFPNALVSGVCPETNTEKSGNTPFLRGFDYIIYGWPTVLIGILVISTIGYALVSNLNL